MRMRISTIICVVSLFVLPGVIFSQSGTNFNGSQTNLGKGHKKRKPITFENFENVGGKSHRIIVKFTDDAKVRRVGKVLKSLTRHSTSGINDELAPDVRKIRSLYGKSQKRIERLLERARTKSGAEQPDLLGTFVIDLHNPERTNAIKIAQKLKKKSFVEYVILDPLDQKPEPPGDISPTTPDFAIYQKYFGGAGGMGIDYAHSLGVYGQGVRISDCEYSYNPDHEDLMDENVMLEEGVEMTGSYESHGTAVLGIITAGRNGYGMTGIVPDAAVHFYPESSRRLEAITNAIADSDEGDVVLLEMQTRGANGNYVPAEYDPSVWNAVKVGTDAGVIVVAAAGNGNENLDEPAYAAYMARGDSGAIIVGAGTADSNHNKYSFSTYGSRIDVQNWGGAVATLGSGYLFNGGDVNGNQDYQTGFSGTSSASALTASAVASIQSYAKQYLSVTLTPAEMRNLLVETGEAQGLGGHVGPAVNVQHAIQMLQVNHSPVIESGAWASPELVALPGTTELSVSVEDPDDDALGYSWSQISGPGVAIFDAADAETCQVTFSAAGSYTLGVIVSDGIYEVYSEVVVTVIADLADFPMEGSWYFIENKYHTLARLRQNGIAETPVVVGTTDQSTDCKWQFIKSGTAWFIQNANGDRLQDGDGTNDLEMVAGTTNDVRAQWDVEESPTTGEFLITSRGGNAQPRIRTDNTAAPDMCASTLIGAFTQWEIVETTAPTSTEPTIEITSPSDGDELLDDEDVIVTVDAEDDSGISQVYLWSNEVGTTVWTLHEKAEGTTDPYTWNLNLSAGNYTLRAKANAKDGGTVFAQNVIITVIPGAVEPTITITSHTDGDELLNNKDVIVTVDADDDSGIEKVHLWSKEEQAAAYTWHGAVTEDPYEWNLGKLPVGTYTLIAKAIANDTETVTTEIIIEVISASTEPTVDITSHEDGGRYFPAGDDVIVTAEALDDSGIEKVHLWSKHADATGWTWHGAVTAEPYEWNLGSELPTGDYELSVRADTKDGASVSKVITITIGKRIIGGLVE